MLLVKKAVEPIVVVQRLDDLVGDDQYHERSDDISQRCSF
jgi:hypothetical protein